MIESDDAPRDTEVKGEAEKKEATRPQTPAEIGGVSGPEPTRYGDWERKGRCIDF